MIVKPQPLIMVTRLRPMRSERLPKMTLPIGRASSPMVNSSVVNVARASTGSPGGRK